MFCLDCSRLHIVTLHIVTLHRPVPKEAVVVTMQQRQALNQE